MDIEARPSTVPTAIRQMFGVVTDGQSYKNIAYLLLSFPLGSFYLVALVAGLGLGISLPLTLVGLPLLFGVLYLGRLLAAGERRLAERLLGLEIERPPSLERWSPMDSLQSVATTLERFTPFTHVPRPQPGTAIGGSSRVQHRE
ncbi:hypothetical protein C440_03823 [Haloferax mucosum ATCC BAA-1512]|uniref:Putative sensor domain-containing protein n=1 Tax=Haloferax mucosum ATCC BAA-1512 TaxID=662479 RepID=M0ILF7_9EURY|nr:sensor domain-containing protein [Haloferax mucosum]ELZ96872.1 hypothetical protein C440_03823 [Haloferax mucosum ATCC BAA-1512]